jgi:cell division protease FtsH
MMEDFDESKDKVMLGPERKSRIMKEDERRMSAYHEAGHAVVGVHLEHADPLHKVSIIPRGRTGGVTSFLPTDDRHEVSREWCIDFITISLGGRVAEELVLNRIGTGAQEDIRQASRLVRKMIMQWGMSSHMGPIAYGDQEEQIFLGKEIAVRRDYSEETAREIDNEVRTLMNECHERARRILGDHRDELHKVAAALLERESLDADDIKILINNGVLPPLKKILANNGGAAKPAASPAETPPAEKPAADAPEPEGPAVA